MASSRNRCHEKARRSEDWLLRRDGPELDTQQSPRVWFIRSTPRVHNSLYELLLSGASTLECRVEPFDHFLAPFFGNLDEASLGDQGASFFRNREL